MLPRANRLVKESEFKQVAQKARPLHSQFLILKKIPFYDNPTVFGLVISAKVSKKAVVRNQIRRRLRAILRSGLPNIASGFKVMLVVKNAMIGRNFKEIESDLNGLLKKSNLL